MKHYAYKCMECGPINISRYDGLRCGRCGGHITPVGEAHMLDKVKKGKSNAAEVLSMARMQDTDTDRSSLL